MQGADFFGGGGRHFSNRVGSIPFGCSTAPATVRASQCTELAPPLPSLRLASLQTYRGESYLCFPMNFTAYKVLLRLEVFSSLDNFFALYVICLQCYYSSLPEYKNMLRLCITISEREGL